MGNEEMIRTIPRMMIRLVLWLVAAALLFSCPQSNAQVFSRQNEFSIDRMFGGMEGRPCPSPSKYDSVTAQPLGEPWQAGPNRRDEEEELLEKIESEMNRSPGRGLLLLGSEIEKELRWLTGMIGLMQGRDRVKAPEAAQLLNSWSERTKEWTEPCMWFLESSRRMVQEKNDDPNEVRKMADLGINALKLARAFPRQTNVVYCTGIPLYSDASLSTPIPGAHGIILGSMDTNGEIADWQLYPTTRTHFRTGMPVSWEWNMMKVYGEIWYRDPNTEEVRQAFGSAAEFAGRDLREL